MVNTPLSLNSASSTPRMPAFATPDRNVTSSVRQANDTASSTVSASGLNALSLGMPLYTSASNVDGTSSMPAVGAPLLGSEATTSWPLDQMHTMAQSLPPSTDVAPSAVGRTTSMPVGERWSSGLPSSSTETMLQPPLTAPPVLISTAASDQNDTVWGTFRKLDKSPSDDRRGTAQARAVVELSLTAVHETTMAKIADCFTDVFECQKLAAFLDLSQGAGFVTSLQSAGHHGLPSKLAFGVMQQWVREKGSAASRRQLRDVLRNDLRMGSAAEMLA